MSPDVSTTDPHRDRAHRFVRRFWIAAVVIGCVLGLGVGITNLSASPRVCASCHEMQPKIDAWRTGAHNQASCAACHEDRRAWYDFPGTLAVRGARLARDWRAHAAGQTTFSVTSSGDATSAVPDSRCYTCHDPAREVTMRHGILIEHAKHAERNKSCLSCHLWTAHPTPDAERPLLLMGRCFDCHSHEPGAKAPGACGTCHPKSFALRPASHKPQTTWKKGRHGKTATVGREACRMCHADSFCSDCHGLEMPHPANWAKGEVTHPSVALRNRSVCTRCHEQGPNFCTMCHHEGYDPKRGPWIVLHPEKVKNTGAAFCMDCHQPTFCVTCHTTGRLVMEALGAE